MSAQTANNAPTHANVYAPPEARVADVVPEGEIELASRGSRLGAQIIDWLIVGIVGGVIGGIIAVSSGYTFANTPLLPVAIVLGWMLIYFAIHGYTLAKDSQTLGKKALGIRIVRSDGSRATFGRIVGLRLAAAWVLGYIPYIGPLFGFADALLIFRESRKCLHDNLADTIVVRA